VEMLQQCKSESSSESVGRQQHTASAADDDVDVLLRRILDLDTKYM